MTSEARTVNRKSRVGVVVSDAMDQTVVVAVERATRHRLYRKVVRRTKKYHVHDPENAATRGDQVRIEECRPISKTKHWQLVEVLTEREVADVAAEVIDRSLVDEVQRTAARAAAEAEAALGTPDAGAAGDSETAAVAATAAVAIGEAAAGDSTAEASGASEPADETSDEPADETGDEPADETDGEPADETSGEPADETGDEPADETDGEPADETSGEPADETGDEPADETGDEPADETGDKAGQQAAVEADDDKAST